MGHRVGDSLCVCGARVRVADNADERADPPQVGDLCLCEECAQPLVFEAVAVPLLWEQVLERLAKQPATLDALAVARARILARLTEAQRSRPTEGPVQQDGPLWRALMRGADPRLCAFCGAVVLVATAARVLTHHDPVCPAFIQRCRASSGWDDVVEHVVRPLSTGGEA